MTSCTKALRFCAGHRLMHHEGECAQLHGHNYTAEITVAAHDLDPIGRVVDFAVIKERVGGWIDAYWDHGFLLNRDDADALGALLTFADNSGVPQKIAYLQGNPTAENIARHLFNVARKELADGGGIELVRVRVWETPTSYAEVTAA
jgi:6-pyruvoyltetrahydropterin/6-carboxytetrahydropterin synthase